MKSRGVKFALVFAILWAQAFAEDNYSQKDDVYALQSAVGHILQRLNDRDIHINTLEDDVKHLTALLADQVETIREQNSQIREQNSRIQHLEEIIRSTSNENHDTSEDTSGQEHAQSSTSSKSASVRTAPYENDAQRIRREYIGAPVAFLAILTNHITHAGAHQPIAFDRVVTNVGGAYNAHLGSFVAPISGIYVFSTTLLSYPGHTTGFGFVKNNDLVSRLYLKTSAGQYETVAQTIVLQLAKGDDITVRNESPDETIHGSDYSTFAGFLIWETENIPAVVG
ncbi:C1QT3-like protein [Mya arenaria]|uniref:C1QT3-like protein n=1 Tax=Mya arenaria TaxID=6604 RepID=A0ABY7FUT6_MYAAR|nr:complement C1q tumor necrosis factor-related protein 3-like [Mya arenaria]WAR25955.1 C1QT3-like protein [Mya arenaria]